MGRLGPRLVLAATHSGAGKTTLATGLLAALARRGFRPAPAKVGPDFIDPGYHAMASGLPGRNLDPWISGEQGAIALAARAAAAGEVLVVEGVMGLFDGAGWSPGPEASPAPGAPFGSSAHLAILLDAPVVLVVDARGLSHSAAALISGYRNHCSRLRLGGVIFNRVGGSGHAELLAEAAAEAGVAVLGMVRRMAGAEVPSRHLGLLPAGEDRPAAKERIDAAAAAVEQGCDLQALVALARSAPPRMVADPPRARPSGAARIAVASGAAFGFSYPDNLEALQDAGAELASFDPTKDEALPHGSQGLYLAGGFPQLAAGDLSANTALLGEIRRAHGQGMPIWAECGGMLLLTASLDGRPMAGILSAQASMSDRLTLGYRIATALADSPLAPKGGVLRGHEFHYSKLSPLPEPSPLSPLRGPSPGRAWAMAGRGLEAEEGFATPKLLATYLHLHLGAQPLPAERFVRACAGGQHRGSSASEVGQTAAGG